MSKEAEKRGENCSNGFAMEAEYSFPSNLTPKDNVNLFDIIDFET